MSTKSCDYLCNNLYAGKAFDPGCCDIKAKCTCGLVSGLYNCVCGPGYFGESGLNGDCKRQHLCPDSFAVSQIAIISISYFAECPIGTYKDTYEPTYKCDKCPKRSTTKAKASSSLTDCLCIAGYHGNPSKSQRCKSMSSMNIPLMKFNDSINSSFS